MSDQIPDTKFLIHTSFALLFLSPPALPAGRWEDLAFNHAIPGSFEKSAKLVIQRDQKKKIELKKPGEYVVACAPKQSLVRGTSWWGLV